MDYFKGTKGEWKHVGFHVEVNDEHIAHVYAGGEYPKGITPEGFDKIEANARLISAAPDLLDAAVSVWVMLDDIPEEAMDDFMKKTIKQLNLSISKALGYKIGKK